MNSPALRPPQIKLTASVKAIDAWLADGQGATEIVYARGTSGAFLLFRGDVKPIADLTRRLEAEGRVALCLRRRGFDDYEWIAQRTKRRPATGVKGERHA
jgi:hypothetical protein